MPASITKFGSLKGKDEHKAQKGGRFGMATVELHSVPPAPVGEHIYYNPGNYTWTCPAGVTTISVVCVGGGGGAVQADFYSLPFQNAGGGGGTLAYKNNITVVPGQGYDLKVGAGGTGITLTQNMIPSTLGNDGEISWFNNTSTVAAGGGYGGGCMAFASPSTGQAQSAAPVGDGGGRGGYTKDSHLNHIFGAGITGGGGAGGYSGDGGGWIGGTPCTSQNATGGGGNHGYGGSFIVAADLNGGPGGGVNVYGTDPTQPYGGTPTTPGESGSFGRHSGHPAPTPANKAVFIGSLGNWNATSAPMVPTGSTVDHNDADATRAGMYGGGGGNGGQGNSSGYIARLQTAGNRHGPVGSGQGGAVRIIWGPGRSFPSTLTSEADSLASVAEN